jgi:FkbM family methyltransferase
MASNSLKPDASDAPPNRTNSTELESLRRVWQTLGRDDPLWAVLSQAGKRGGRWDAQDFLATGRVEIEVQMAALGPTGYPHQRGLALDFGCGAGRLTRALASHFKRVVGIDVSASMIATARQLNQDLDNVEFRENASPRLEGIADASVDFVFSHITLQHIPTELAAGYVEEFLRVLAPGGAAVFQFVDAADESLRGRLFGLASNRWLNPLRRVLWRRRAVFEMHPLPQQDLDALLARRPSMRLLSAFDDGAAGPGWHGLRWTVVNDAAEPVKLDCGAYVLYADPTDVQIGAPLLAGYPHDPHVTAVLRERLKGGDVVLDIGANIGSVALLAASLVGAEGRVIAVEPIQHNRVLLMRAAQENGFAQLQVIAAAASDHDGEIALRTHPSTSNSATPSASGDRLRAPEGETVRVRTRAFDRVLESLQRLDLVKVDVEGMEPLALRGLERTLARFQPALISEFHPWAIERAAGSAPLEYLDFLRRFYGVIHVLHRDGRRERCADPQAVMEVWRRENAAAGLDGRLHLDLLLTSHD